MSTLLDALSYFRGLHPNGRQTEFFGTELDEWYLYNLIRQSEHYSYRWDIDADFRHQAEHETFPPLLWGWKTPHRTHPWVCQRGYDYDRRDTYGDILHTCRRHSDCRSVLELGLACQAEEESIRAWVGTLPFQGELRVPPTLWALAMDTIGKSLVCASFEVPVYNMLAYRSPGGHNYRLYVF